MKSNFKLNCCLGCLALLNIIITPGLAHAGNLEINTGRVNVRMSRNGNLSINMPSRYVDFSSTGLKVPSYRSSPRRGVTRHSRSSCQGQNYQSSRVSRRGNSRVSTQQTTRTQVCY